MPVSKYLQNRINTYINRDEFNNHERGIVDIHLIVELTDTQKEYRVFFSKMLKQYGVKSPTELSDDEKKKFFSAVDKAWNAEHEAGADGLTRNDRLQAMKETVKLRLGHMNRTYSHLAEDDDSDDAEKDTINGADPDGGAGEDANHELVIEFPDHVRVEFTCRMEDSETIKTRAQELYDGGSSPVDVAKTIAKEFESVSWEVAGGEEEKDDEIPDIKEGFASYMEGSLPNPGKLVERRNNDKRICEEVDKRLDRITGQINIINEAIDDASVELQNKLRLLVKEHISSMGNVLLEDEE